MLSDTVKKVGILRGMAGDHYDSSLKKGGGIISFISENLKDKWHPLDIFVDKNYIWHFNGIPVNPSDLAHKVDVVWNVSHPSLSNILESLSIPNIGVSGFSSMLEKNREMLREHAKMMGLKMSRRIVIPLYQKDFDGPREKYAFKKAKEVFEKFGAPWMVSSFTPDSSMGVHVAKTFHELVEAIEDGINHGRSISVEEFIEGRSLSAHSVPKFRNEDIYVFSSDKFSLKEKESLRDLVKILHVHVGSPHYLKSDFILHPRRGFFLRNVDFHPDFEEDSHFEQSSLSIGAKINHVVEHILGNAIL